MPREPRTEPLKIERKTSDAERGRKVDLILEAVREMLDQYDDAAVADAHNILVDQGGSITFTPPLGVPSDLPF